MPISSDDRKTFAVAANSLHELAYDLGQLAEIDNEYNEERQKLLDKLNALALKNNRDADRWADNMDKKWTNWREVVLSATQPKQ